MALTLAQIASVNDKPVASVDVPEWGGTVCVRTLGAREFGDWLKLATAGNWDEIEQMVRFIVLAACDETGKPIFTDADVPFLCLRPRNVLERISDAAAKLNGMSAEGKSASASDSPTDSR